MGRTWGFLCTATLALIGSGCVSGPMQENPVLIRPNKPSSVDNPVYLPLGPNSYGAVFEKVQDVLDDYFEIAYTNRYNGEIETFPRVAPGLGEMWKGGSPDLYQRLLATLQSMRNRAVVRIFPADDGGYFVSVMVYRELEDLAQPIKSNTSSAVFRNDNGLERQFEIIDATTYDAIWIPKGRDLCMEQEILDRLAHAKYECVKPATAPPVP